MEPGKRQLSIEYVPLTTVKRWPRNPKEHDLGQIHQSMARFGFVNPLIVNEATGELLAGHGRLDTLEQRHAAGDPPPDGIQANNGHWMIPVVRGITLATEEAAAYTIADNRLVELGAWNDADLAAILQEINLEGVGFNQDDLDEILKGLNPPEPQEDPGPQLDKAAELQEQWGTALGQIWEIPSVNAPGKSHRLICGDATDCEAVRRLMGQSRAAMTFTDPPYNVDYGNHGGAPRKGTRRTVANDNLGTGFQPLLEKACRNILEVTDGAIYICMSSSELHTLQEAFVSAGGHWSTFIIWAKSTFTVGRSDYQRQYEPILYGWREGSKHHWCGDRDQGDLWHVEKSTSNPLHPTMKPLPLMERAIQNSSEPGDKVLDLFLGSGSTLIACERTGRACYSMELEPKYVAVTLERMAGMGLEPRRVNG